MKPLVEIHDAVARLHSAAWHGRKIAPGDKPRFSIPRQPSDDDEVVYAAVEELGRLRDAARRALDALDALEAEGRLGSTTAAILQGVLHDGVPS